MIVVADASVALKWFLPDAAEDAAANDVATALEILEAAAFGRLQLVQPVHFIAEVAAVLARLKPTQAQDDLLDLLHVEQQIADSPEIYATAIELAERLDHHLFDTLYHAVALHTPDAIFVTADRRYHAKAHHLGSILPLIEFKLPPR